MSEQNPDVRTAFFPESLIFQLSNAEDLFKIELEIFFDEVQLARRKAKIWVKKKFLIFSVQKFLFKIFEKKKKIEVFGPLKYFVALHILKKSYLKFFEQA